MDATPQTWVNIVAGAFMALAGWVLRMYTKKVDHIESSYVTREDLAKLLTASEARHMQMHGDNTNNFREVRLSLESVNNKLYDLSGKIK